MRSYRFFLLGAAILIPQLGGAQLQLPPQAFAKLEGVLDYCTKALPQDAPKYEKLRMELIKDVPEAQITEVRKTQEYKDAYSDAKAEFVKMGKEKALKACSASLEK